MHSGGQRVEAGHTFGNQRWFLLLIATDQPPSPRSASHVAGLISKQIWKLHSVTWCVMRGYHGVKTLISSDFVQLIKFTSMLTSSNFRVVTHYKVQTLRWLFLKIC